jgi:hypothetical protein
VPIYERAKCTRESGFTSGASLFVEATDGIIINIAKMDIRAFAGCIVIGSRNDKDTELSSSVSLFLV